MSQGSRSSRWSGSGKDSDEANADPDTRYVASSFDALQRSFTCGMINDPNWGSRDPPDFHARGVIQSGYSFPYSSSQSVPRSTSSMAVSSASFDTHASSSSYPQQTPPLVRSQLSSETSSVSRASNVSPIDRYRLPSYGSGGGSSSSRNSYRSDSARVNASAPRRYLGPWQCPFRFLECAETFGHFDDWNTHSQAHFRGHLPSKIACPFTGCEGHFALSRPSETWQAYEAHVRTHHPYGGRAEYDRSDPDLIKHLWSKGVISDLDEQDLRMYGRRGGSGRPAMLIASSMRRDNRQRSRPPGGGRFL